MVCHGLSKHGGHMWIPQWVAFFEEKMISLGVAYIQTNPLEGDASSGFGCESADFNITNYGFL